MVLIEKFLQVDRCSLMIMENDQKTLKIKKTFGITGVDLKNVKVKVGKGIAGSVAASGRPLLIKNIEEELTQLNVKSPQNQFYTNSLLSVPLITQGKVIGVINVNNKKNGQSFVSADEQLLSIIGVEIAVTIQRSYLVAQLEKAKEIDRDINHSMV